MKEEYLCLYIKIEIFVMYFVFDFKIVGHLLKWFVNKIEFQYMYSLFNRHENIIIHYKT